MKIHLIKKQSILDYIENNSQSRASLITWLSIIKQVDWNEPSDIISTFNSADILGNGTNRVIFNIGGNKYRIICSYYFGKTKVHLFINWIGTHSLYTKLCNNKLQYSINKY